MKTKHWILLVVGIAAVAVAARYFYKIKMPAATTAANPASSGVQITATGVTEPVIMPAKPIVVTTAAPAV